MTKRETYALILNSINPDCEAFADIETFILHEIEKLDARKNAEKKPTAKQIENADIKSRIFAEMQENVPYTVTEMQTAIPACAFLTNQRITALLRQMSLENMVTRSVDKRRTIFTKIIIEEEA